MKNEIKIDKIFEVSWEVCNKIGGINTVLKSKMPLMIDHYKEKYYTIGPFFQDKVKGEFEELPHPEEFEGVFKKLENEGVFVHFGKWLTDGKPATFLIDFSQIYWKLNDIKKELWEGYNISSIRAGHDYDEPLVWSYAVGRFLEEISKIKNEKIVSHFHEWLAGPAILYLKKNKIDIATVFTTHATILGRSMSSGNFELYENIKNIDSEKESYNYGIEAKHGVEKNSAINSNVFTTVSEITGLETQFLLNKKPDIILPNGLNLDKFPTFEDSSLQHHHLKARMREFTCSYFFPYYHFDIYKTLFYFLAGRYEIRDKGIDVFIKSLSKLNKELIEKKSDKTIVAFIWVPGHTQFIDPEILENKMNFHDIRENLDLQMPFIRNSILFNILSKIPINEETTLYKPFLESTKKKIMKFSKEGNPPISTHELHHKDDAIYNMLISEGLDNREENKVKVIFYPIYLNSADGLLELSYQECMQAAHLGVFPSFYEPWGYTPLEAAAIGVSSVTTDLSGFGKYIQKSVDKKYPGIFVLQRRGKNEDEIVGSLTNFMSDFTSYSSEERVKNKIKAKKLSLKADWKILIKEYFLAHDLAYKKQFGSK